MAESTNVHANPQIKAATAELEVNQVATIGANVIKADDRVFSAVWVKI